MPLVTYDELRINDKVEIKGSLDTFLEPYATSMKRLIEKHGTVKEIDSFHWKGYKPILVEFETEFEEESQFWFRRADLKKIGGN